MGLRNVPVAREAVGVAAVAAAGAIAAPAVAGKALKWLGRAIAGKEPKSAKHQQVEKDLIEARSQLENANMGLGCSITLAVITAAAIAIFWPWHS